MARQGRRRTFDWDEARRLRYEEGWTQAAIASYFGVCQSAVSKAIRALDERAILSDPAVQEGFRIVLTELREWEEKKSNPDP